MYNLSENIAISQNENCCIILNLESSVYYIFDLTAMFIIVSIKSGFDTVESITKHMCNVYEVDSSIAQQDIITFLSKCIEHGIIVEG